MADSTPKPVDMGEIDDPTPEQEAASEERGDSPFADPRMAANMNDPNFIAKLNKVAAASNVPTGAAPKPSVADADFAKTPAELAAEATPAVPAPALHATTAHETAVVDPRRQAEIASDLGAAREAVTRQGEAAGGLAFSEGATKENVAKTLKRQADEAYKRIDQNKGSYQEQVARLADVEDQAKSAGIDPDRYLKSKSPGERFMMTLAAMVAGAAAGYNRQSGNAAIEAQRADKDADIAAQREDVQGKRLAVSDYRARLAEQAKQMDADEATIARASELERQGVTTEGEASGAGFKAQLAQAAADEKGATMGAAGAKEMAGMNRFSPAGIAGGVDPNKLASTAFEIMKFDAENGLSTTPEQARAKAYAVLTGGTGAGGLAPKPAAGGKGGPITLTPPKSTEWNPLRGLQGTEGFRSKEGQEQWNAGVEAALIRGGISPRAVKDIAAPYRVEPGMSKDTIESRVSAFATNFGGGGQPQASAGAAAPRKIVMRPIPPAGGASDDADEEP